ncbi:MAG TPA: YgjP-like metallopeptidase domain-containing protein, partial [Bacillota bacterium]|nr:YgjP-like metallopeptidase domain-containing protein [Bacillota bacterium]
MAEIIINGRPVECTLKTSARAKRISITIKHDRITVTMPVGANTQQALSFLESKQDWLARHLKENHWQMAGSGRPDELSNQILYLGRWHQAELGRSKGRKIQIGLTANTVQILLPDRLPGVEGQEV